MAASIIFQNKKIITLIQSVLHKTKMGKHCLSYFTIFFYRLL
ncbi:hypothetical protein PMI08_02888 [Brevibacillus sp. CF112]|nr:hypothetical protein PMI08_02888 [Brevibacillus sp. CF112]